MPMLNLFAADGQMHHDAASRVFSTALFPGPTETRQRDQALALECYNARQAGRIDHIPQEVAFRLIEDGVANIRNRMTKRIKQGARVGRLISVLFDLTVTAPADASLATAAAITTNLARPTRHKAGKVPAGINGAARRIKDRDWPALRAAAHLWAAIETARESDPLSDHWLTDEGALGHLLFIAEGFRHRLETFVVRNGRGPILPKGIAWRMPFDFVAGRDFYVPAVPPHIRQMILDTRAEAKQPHP